MDQNTVEKTIKNLKVSEGFITPDERPTIFKKVLTGYASIKIKAHTSPSWVKTVPVFQTSFNEEVEEFGIELQQNEEIISIVPPCKLTYGVWALMPEDSTTFEDFKTGSYTLDLPVFLGFEFENNAHPNWSEEYKKKLLDMFISNKTLFDW